MECEESDTASGHVEEKKKYVVLTDTEVSQEMFYDEIQEIVSHVLFLIGFICLLSSLFSVSSCFFCF